MSVRYSFVAMLALACTSVAQTVPIHSQTLTQDTVWNFPTQPVQFDKGAKIVTNGFQLTLRAQSISAQQALIVAFETKAPNGPNGADGPGYGANGQDGSDGGYGRRGSKVLLQAKQYIGQTNSLIVRVNGEDAGDGGKGGNGAAGRNGNQGDGPDVSDCWFGSCRRAGGNGGPGTAGGDAGYGGRAGDGGNGGVVVLAIGSGGDKIGYEFHGGLGGKGGSTGAAGTGGQGGGGGNGDKCCGGGHPGPSGANGRGGANGRDGRNGQAGDVIFINGADQAAFIQEFEKEGMAGLAHFMQSGKK